MNGRVNVCMSSIIRSNGSFDSNYAIAAQISAKVSVDLHELEQKSMLTTACWPAGESTPSASTSLPISRGKAVISSSANEAKQLLAFMYL